MSVGFHGVKATAIVNDQAVPRARTARRPGKHLRFSKPKPGAVAYRRILVPVDFKAGSDAALRQATALALAHHARILPVHVTRPICFTMDYGYGPVNRAVPDETSLRQTGKRLDRLVHRVMPSPLASNVSVRSGEPVDEIVAAAKEWKADLIVVNAHEALGRESESGSHTLDHLIRQVGCPVLVIHPSRDHLATTHRIGRARRDQTRRRRRGA
jgi:nucleotide-binding universal stress UspA family protein